jgi:metal transporter CNNM
MVCIRFTTVDGKPAGKSCSRRTSSHPHTATRVADVIDIFGRNLHAAWINDNLGDVLRELKKGRSHMALVRDPNDAVEGHDSPLYALKGIITLEDIIEEILGKTENSAN